MGRWKDYVGASAVCGCAPESHPGSSWSCEKVDLSFKGSRHYSCQAGKLLLLIIIAITMIPFVQREAGTETRSGYMPKVSPSDRGIHGVKVDRRCGVQTSCLLLHSFFLPSEGRVRWGGSGNQIDLSLSLPVKDDVQCLMSCFSLEIKALTFN